MYWQMKELGGKPVLLIFKTFDISSGSQQDGVEFLTLLLASLPSEFSDCFSFSERVVRKFVGVEEGACPDCLTMPQHTVDLQIILHIDVPNIEHTISLTDLIHKHFSPKLSDAGKRCNTCCPHQHTTCPGTEIRCSSKQFSEQKTLINTPSNHFIQLKRFAQAAFGQNVKTNIHQSLLKSLLI